MLYREAGQFKTSYHADQALFPILQDKIGLIVVLLAAFIGAIVIARRKPEYEDEGGEVDAK